MSDEISSKESLQKNTSSNPLTLTVAEFQQQKMSDSRMLRNVQFESVWGLLEHCEICLLNPDQVLLRKHDSNQSLYLILSGKLSVRLESPDSDPVAYLGLGETVGEMSVIDGSPASAFVVADSLTRLLVIDFEVFWRLVRVSHEFSINLLLLLAERLRFNNTMITKSAKLREKFELAAMTDGLTGLHNRRWLNQTLPRLTSRYQNDDTPFSLMMLDIDHFKRFNDDFGHLAGDRVLIVLGKSIKDGLRPIDLSARYGGEEFVVLLPNADLDGAEVAAERLRERVRSTDVSQPGMELPSVRVSIGVATLRLNESADGLLKRADEALYRAKEKGRDRVERG